MSELNLFAINLIELFENFIPRYYTSRGKPTGEPICGDLHAVKQRSAGTAEEAEDQRYQETTQSGYRKSQWAKQSPRRICRGTREVPKYLQGISVSTEKQKDALHKHELL